MLPRNRFSMIAKKTGAPKPASTCYFSIDQHGEQPITGAESELTKEEMERTIQLAPRSGLKYFLT